jgi:hypothetical protein
MRIATDDGRLGFVVSWLSGSAMFRFQLVVSGKLVATPSRVFCIPPWAIRGAAQLATPGG